MRGEHPPALTTYSSGILIPRRDQLLTTPDADGFGIYQLCTRDRSVRAAQDSCDANRFVRLTSVRPHSLPRKALMLYYCVTRVRCRMGKSYPDQTVASLNRRSRLSDSRWLSGLSSVNVSLRVSILHHVAAQYCQHKPQQCIH